MENLAMFLIISIIVVTIFSRTLKKKNEEIKSLRTEKEIYRGIVRQANEENVPPKNLGKLKDTGKE